MSTPHCPVCGYGADTSSSRVCYACCHQHRTLNEALNEFGVTTVPRRNRTKDLVLHGRVIATECLPASAWEVLARVAFNLGDPSAKPFLPRD